MKKCFILVSLLLVFVVNLTDGRRNRRPKNREVIFTEEEILSQNSSRKGLPNKRIKNPDFRGKLPNQVFIRVSFAPTPLNYKCVRFSGNKATQDHDF